jgi:hypothetical protein
MVALFGVCMLFVHHTNIKQKIVDFGILVGCVLLPIINVVVGVLNWWSSIVDTALSIENQTSFFRIYDPESPSLAAWRLDGFRRHTYDNFVTSYGYLDYPSIIFFSLFVFVVLGYGYLLYHNKQKLFWISILLVGLLAYILSLAGNGVVFDTIHRFINDNIPRYGGMRDPQKRLIVVLILYTICYARWVVLIQTIHHRLSYFVLSFALALPLLYGNYIFLHDHYFSTTDYPNDRYSAKQYLETIDLCQQTWCYDVLVVPWHLYISFHFTDGVVGNPSDRFFLPAKILQGDNIEIWSIYSHSTRSASKTIESYLWPDWLLPTTDQNIISNFMDALEALGIKHIVLLKETDWQHYDDLLQRTLVGNLGSIVIDDPYIRVYRLK